MARYLHINQKNNIAMKEEEIKNKEEEEILEETENSEVSEVPEVSERSEEPEAAEVSIVEDPLEIAQAEIELLKDKYLRSVAEFDNYRKRTLKEKAELILNGSEKTVSAILPVIDDMERAIENGQKTEDPTVLREGMELIYQKFMKALESLGVKKIEADGTDFDTDLHEAVAMVPGIGDDKKGKVIDCLQTGYQLNDKVIRHAKVAVGQ